MEKVTYDVYSLFEEKGDGYSGPMSPVLFADEIMKQLEVNYNRLARVNFDEPEVHNQYEKGEGLTGYDTLITAGIADDGEVYHMIMLIDMGSRGIPVAFYTRKSKEIVVSKIYKEVKFKKKLNQKQIETIMRFTMDNDKFAVKKAG